MEQKIIRPDGTEYMTVFTDGDMIEFRNFGRGGYIVKFDVEVLDQLLPFLNEANFWRKVND